MSSTLFAAKKSSASELAELLKSNRNFHNTGRTFTGQVWDHDFAPEQGRMAAPEFAELVERNVESRIEYVIWSYGTVIAYRWNGEWYVSAAKYSATTSQHQSQTAVAVSLLVG